MCKSVITPLHFVYSEESMLENRERQSTSFATMDQLELSWVVSETELKTKTQNVHFAGSTSGNYLVNVPFGVSHADSSIWKMQRIEKKRLYGTEGSIQLAGGPVTNAEGAKPPKTLKTDMCPMNWRARSPLLWAELIRRFSPRAIVMLCEADTILSEQALVHDVPIVSWTHTEEMAETFKTFLTKRVLTRRVTPGDNWYNSDLATILTNTGMAEHIMQMCHQHRRRGSRQLVHSTPEQHRMTLRPRTQRLSRPRKIRANQRIRNLRDQKQRQEARQKQRRKERQHQFQFPVMRTKRNLTLT